eukprot:3658086-Rhodomonas_salina.2
MSKEEQLGLLLTSFEARVLAETAEEKDEVWNELKQRWGEHQQHASRESLIIGSIFDLVEAELKGRLLAAGGATAVAEQTLDDQIFEIIGPTPLDPNQAQWMREGTPKVDLTQCTPLEFLRAHQTLSTQDFVKALVLQSEPFQLETLEVLIDNDKHCGIPTAHEYLRLRDRLTHGRTGTEHALGRLASLTLGPALKLQADLSVASSESRAPVTTLPTQLQAPAIPTGRRRQRKGIPKQSPINGDSWNDDPFDADLLQCSPSEEDCFKEVAGHSTSPFNLDAKPV